jgi:5'-3' exoribonuclease 2
MGVPGFFLYLMKNYKKDKFVYNRQNANEDKINTLDNLDYLLIDANCLIHPMCFKVLADNPLLKDIDKLEKKMLVQVTDYIEKIINIVNPKKGVYIAIDGVAPLAKLKQQRMRRFKSVKEKELYNNIRKKHKRDIVEDVWTNSAITPGTKFMKKLNTHILKWINKNISSKNNLNYIYSSCNTNGEGEHKLLQYVYKNQISNPNDTYIFYGLDADLIFLTLATGIDNIFLLREADQINKKRSGFDYVDINIMRNAICNSIFNIIKKNDGNDIIKLLDKSRLIDDFIFICYMMGNDFLPHLPALDIYNGAIDNLLDIYVDIIMDNIGEYIYDKKNRLINQHIFKLFIFELSINEDEYIKMNANHKRKFKCKSSDPYDKEIHKIENMMFKINDPIKLDTDGFRERYYQHYFHTTDEEYIKKVVYEYIKGLKWTGLYYFDKCADYQYFYKYSKPPFLTDIYKYMTFDIKDIKFTLNPPLSPFEQLLCVLPKKSAFLLPKPLRKIMLNLNSSVAHLYPDDYELDMLYKHKYWMCEPILPDIDVDSIRHIFNKYEKKLNDEELLMNTIVDVYEFNG